MGLLVFRTVDGCRGSVMLAFVHVIKITVNAC